MAQLTTDLIRTLAEVNGLTIPEERLELVRQQYESFLRSLRELNALELPLEAEPAFVFGHHVTVAPDAARDRED